MSNWNVTNINLTIEALKKNGITNPYLQTGILAVTVPETGLRGISEISYMNTSVARLRQIWPTTLKNYSDAELEVLKKDNIKFFDAVYGGKGGNKYVGDGYKYRGRGFNQITFRDTYKKYGDALGIDLINNPDLLNKPEVAAAALALFFKNSIQTGIINNVFRDKYGITDPNDVSDLTLATKIAQQINTGVFDTWNTIDYQSYNKALAALPELSNYTFPSYYADEVVVTAKRKRNVKRTLVVGGILLAAAGTYYYVKKKRAA